MNFIRSILPGGKHRLMSENKSLDISKITQATISINGPITINATSANITCPTNTINGNVKIDGTLDVTGMIKSDDDVRAQSGSVGLLTHTHPGIFPGPSSTATGQG